MKPGYLILLLICAVVTAVPRMKRSEEATVEGSTVKGSTLEGSTAEGSRAEGSTAEGSTGVGSTGEGSTGEGSTLEGSTVQRSTVVPTNDDAGKTKAPERICAPTTPCGWSIYNSENKRIEINLKNTYCVCSADTICDVYEDDTSASTLVNRCMKPGS